MLFSDKEYVLDSVIILIYNVDFGDYDNINEKW